MTPSFTTEGNQSFRVFHFDEYQRVSDYDQ